ncbi:cyclophilin-like fold protein [Sphingobacterium chuzhouense]|nr:cyclophilin-like fold protein [Sphingobacterium chuzhouense]
MANGKIKITVNSQTFTATLLDNNSAKAFKEMLPMTINMVELNNNEKYFDLPNSLPTNSSNPQTINNGDLMLYGSKTLVLFYKTFSTSYSYTRLGKIDDTTGLATALGSGNVTVTFNTIDD